MGRRVGIDCLITVRFKDRLGDAKRTHHIPVCCARGIDSANILIIKDECQANAVAKFDIAFAVSDLVEHEATCYGTEGISLIIADLEWALGVLILSHSRVGEKAGNESRNPKLHGIFSQKKGCAR